MTDFDKDTVTTTTDAVNGFTWVPIQENTADKIDDLADDVYALRRRVSQLEMEITRLQRKQDAPSNAFYGQLLFDAMMYIGFIWILILQFS